MDKVLQVYVRWHRYMKVINQLKTNNLSKFVIFYLGSVVRCIRRLEELLRQMCCAAKAIGNSELEAKFTEGIFIKNL